MIKACIKVLKTCVDTWIIGINKALHSYLNSKESKGEQIMGMSGSQSRLLMLTARLSDLELQAQAIQNSKIRNSVLSMEAASNYADALYYGDTSDATTASYEAYCRELEVQDKLFDMELKNIDTEHTACQTEVDSVKKVIDKNIERTFKVFDA